jgi:hypothetical protein
MLLAESEIVHVTGRGVETSDSAPEVLPQGKFPPDRLDGDIVEEIATQRQVEIDAIVA